MVRYEHGMANRRNLQLEVFFYKVVLCVPYKTIKTYKRKSVCVLLL